MLKLILCLTTAAVIAVGLLCLRQQRLDLNYQSNKLHDAIEYRQAQLWNQQLQIAVYTAPNAIRTTVGEHQLDLTPLTNNAVGPSDWINARADVRD